MLVEKIDWADEKACLIVKDWQKPDDSGVIDLMEFIAQALREAEARGMERAAKIADRTEDDGMCEMNLIAKAIRADAAKAQAE